MNENEILQALSDPSVHPEDKKKLLAQYQGQQSAGIDWPTTIAALGTDALVGAYGAEKVNNWWPTLGNSWKKEKGIRSWAPSGSFVRGTIGALTGGGIGLGGALGYKALENYFNPLEQRSTK